MDGAAIQFTAAKTALSLSGVTQSQPFGPEYEVFKVGGKVFMMTTQMPGDRIVTAKCDPDRSKMLRDLFPSIRPGYHMNKTHWISIAAGGGVTTDLIESVVSDAYGLVAAKLPRDRRPETV